MAEDPRLEDRQDTTSLSAFKMGRALVEAARPVSRQHTSSYHDNERFALGENQWPQSLSWRAAYRSRWKNQSVRNYTMSTIDQKLATILGAEPGVAVEPMNEEVTYDQRQDIGAAVRHEMDRMHYRELREDQTIDGAILGKGILHFYPERDPFTGMVQVQGELVDPNRFYPDPARTRLYQCRYVVYEPDLDMASVRRIFPDTYKLVKATERPVGKFNPEIYGRTSDDLIYGETAGEYIIKGDGQVLDRRADVAFVFIKDPTVVEEAKSVLERAPVMGYRCRSCGNEFETDAATYEPMTDTGNPRCPECGSGELSREMLPPLVRQETERTRKYPFGRLICLTENALLYDGPSKYQLREVFPFAEYVHNRVTRRFWGQGDVARLTEVQLALNKNMAQAIDNLRMNGNRPQEVPAEVPAYRRLGNRPGDQVPVPAAYMGLARYLEGSSYDVRLHQVVDQQLKEDFKEIAGVTPASLGFIGTPPPSGVALEKSLSAGNTRVGRQATAREQGDTDAANIIWQMMNQFYREPRSFNKRLPSGEVEAIVTEVSELPRDVFVKVSISVNREEKDKLFGQNLMLAVKDGHVGFYPDLMLPMMGAPDREVVKEIASREEQRQRALQAAAAPPGTNLPQGAGTESPPPGVPPEMAGALAPPRGP